MGSDRAKATDAVWQQCWLPFLSNINISDPYLSGIDDKIPIIRVFAQRLRVGTLSRSHLAIRATHVRDEVLRVAKVFTELGAKDPRLTSTGDMDTRLTSLYKGWANEDPAPRRVKPMPLPILHHAADHQIRTDAVANGTIDMAWIAVFYLLRPGEYCKSQNNTPLTIGAISLMIGTETLDILNCHPHRLLQATHSSITFDNQKNRK